MNRTMNSHWQRSNEIQHLMSEILADDRELAVQYRDEHLANPSDEPDIKLSETRLRRIVKIWNRHFPGRRISLDYQPVVERQIDKEVVTYPIAHMSEGERTALYLITRVISCGKDIVLVDEPETFFHPLLARNLWNDLEAEMPNLRFIYVTHDIPFALSRRGAQFAVARSEIEVDVLPPTSEIPSEVITEVLGAASFSISASRLIFCEGRADSLDQAILSAWHNCDNTAVIPVGSCQSVRECVSVFREQNFTDGLEAFGYIDRDGWPDRFLIVQNIKAHQVSEIEGIFALETVFKALAKFNGADENTANEQFEAFLKEARGAFSDVNLNKQILTRAKLRAEVELKALLNPIAPNEDLKVVGAAFEKAEPEGGWQNYLGKIFTEEQSRLEASLHGEPREFVRDFPAKSYFGMAAKHLKLVPEKMVEALCNALLLTDAEADKEQKLKQLRDAIVPVLEKCFWSRRA